MPGSPIPPKPRCDCGGCGNFADFSTDGTEVDSQNRVAVKGVNVCNHHSNWPHSDDARLFVESDAFKRRA